MIYLSHKDRESGREQTLADHLRNTGSLAQGFAQAFGAGAAGAFCGRAHDIGKYSAAFQRRVQGAMERVNHSTAGALEAKRLHMNPAAFCIAGHHGGLPDLGGKADAVPESGTLFGCLSRKVGRDIEDYSAYKDEIDFAPCGISDAFISDNESAMFFTRMLFSCLVDADWLDTEAFMKAGRVQRGGFEALEAYREKLEKMIRPWLDNPRGALGAWRNEILRAAIACGELPPGLFSLTAPTGSGKTWASMAFALYHALKWKKRRIIYVIPYCSIIDQTHAVFEEAFGPQSVVAHYANVEYKNGEENGDKRYLAAENWDAPVILTTTVQFFDSLYGNKPSSCRKLHNLANSVIIFDEAQMLPPPFLRPCVHAIAQLVAHYGCSAVLCTATQPSLGPLFAETLKDSPVREICPRPGEMYQLFRRVRYEKLGVQSDESLIERLTSHERALCIVNRRAQAQELFDRLPKKGRFHLSTTMCPADRRAVLSEIRRRLNEGLVCRVVATSLVEAGVDVDFPVVYRALAGLDSILQAGGRCNREGKESAEHSVVYIFEPEESAPTMFAQNISSARMALARFPDPASPEAVTAYFTDLFYTLKGMDALDQKRIIELSSGRLFPFETIAQAFHLIESVQNTVYIPCPESEPLLARLQRGDVDRALMRKLGAYAVGVYPQLYNDLLRVHAVESVADGAGILIDAKLYDAEKGLVLSVPEGTAYFG